MRDDFAVFILSHGRPDKVVTIKTLKRIGYTGKWYLVLDDEDSTRQEYINTFGEDHILLFNKDLVERTFDTMDNLNNKKVVIYARNVCFDFAKKLNLNYFLELDDDYVRFELRTEKDGKLLTDELHHADDIFECVLNYLDETNATTIAFAQGGDLIGGLNGSKFKQKVLRKAMNSFFCKTSKPFKFMGRINEDVNTYTTLGSRGDLFLTLTNMDLIQVPTQQHKGGMSESYLDVGTYYKSFYTILTMPSCVRIDTVGDQHARIHHSVLWENCVPKIISGRFRHGETE